MKILPLYFNKKSMNLLILLMAVHILGTLVAYTVYINLSSLGDGYSPSDYDPEYYSRVGFNRTGFVHAIYYYLGNILPNFWAPLALGQIVAIATWHAFRDIYLYMNRQVFWACNLFPLFLIWSGSSSKEQIFIIFGIIVIGFISKRIFLFHKLSLMNWFLVCFSLAILCYIRPNYFVIYFTIFLTSIFAPMLNKMKIYKLSVGVWSVFFILTTLAVIYFVFSYFSQNVFNFMKTVELSILSLQGGSSRYDIYWDEVSDFFYNSLWGVPQGLIGPTLMESILKPIQFPVFLEGLAYLFILSYLFIKLLKLAYASNKLRIYILPYIFVTLLIIYVSYPYGIFNAGAALRYKQALHPVLFFYPLLILTYARVNHLVNEKL